MKWRIAIFSGPLLGILVLLFTDLDPARPEMTRTAAVALLMAAWWVTEAIPLAATALIPVVLFPVLEILSGKEVAGLYFNHIIFLFLGAFMVAQAMQRWDLDRRIGLKILALIGRGPSLIMLGFMLTTAFLSMWISNTATAMMMVPIAYSVILKLEEEVDSRVARRFSCGLLLGIAYSASIGGISTLVGTPPNLAFARILQINFPGAPEISFSSWFFFAFPLCVVFFFIAWLLLILVFRSGKEHFKFNQDFFKKEYEKLGPISFEQKIVLTVFGMLALLWMTRSPLEIGFLRIPGWSSIFPRPDFIDDGTVAITLALILFFLPSRDDAKRRILDWHDAVKLPWGIVLLFGGGFALAHGFQTSGLSAWIGNQLTAFQGLPVILIVLSICALMTFITELTSNTATTQMILPILAAMSVSLEINPLLLMVPATLSASCAFMLPVATPPNAVVFGTGRLRVVDMVRVGIFLNIIGIILITAAIFILGPLTLGIDISVFPEWAK